MDKNEYIKLPKDNKGTYDIYHKRYYITTRKFREGIMKMMTRYTIPLSVYEEYIDDDMNFINLQEAYLACKNYVNIIKIQNLVERKTIEIEKDI